MPLRGDDLRHIALLRWWKAGLHLRGTAGSWGIVFMGPPAWQLPGLLVWALGFTA